MAKVIIVSRTRMAGDKVCVGGVDIDNRISLRLLTARGTHENASECPYQIWDIWDIDYYLTRERPTPHTEDAKVTRRSKVDRVDALNLSVNRFADSLESLNIPLFRGSLFSVFDGKLKLTDMDKMYISKEDVPTYSTCFWINDKRLLGYTNDRGRWQYRYNDMSNRYGYTISYVGSAEPPADIEAGSLIRLSLAHWWKPTDSDDEERCYLQLSGCLIQGNTKENIPPVIDATPPAETANPIQNDDWFDSYEHELDKLLIEKTNLEERIKMLRSSILQQMEERHLDKIASAKYQVNYSPAKTTMQFDRKSFKKENEDLYSFYCVPIQKEASIVIRKAKKNSEAEDENMEK